MPGPTFADGDVPTGQNFNDYLSAKGLLKTKKITSGDFTFSALNSEQLVDTIDNVAVGAGCAVNRAIELIWQLMATVGSTYQSTFVTRAYYKAASSFGTVSGATQFFNSPFAFDLANYKDDIITMHYLSSLAPATTYSFGLTITKTIEGESAVATVLRSSASYPRLVILNDVGLGTHIG